MSNMSDFFTREKANAGIKIDLPNPDGTKSEEWIIIRGVDSDDYRAAYDESLRSAFVLIDIKDEELKKKVRMEKRLDILVSLVASWSFEQDCNIKNITTFLTEAPQIAKLIDKSAADRQSFFGKSSTNSTNSPELKSESTRKSKVRK